MVEFVKGKLIIGPIIALIGGSLLLIGGMISFPLMVIALQIYLLYAIPFIMAIIFGLLGILGGIVGLMGNMKGNYIAIIIGFVTTIGMFVPFFIYSFIFIDPILILIGGILGVLIEE
ncbi:MAG: hypothetical protein ACXAAH_08095 [Promethearchaeota archaeon]|jgi:hypothetical protein